MTARASPNLAVPSKITEASFTSLSSFLSLSFSFSSTAGMSSLRWARLVNLWPYFSSKGRRASTFANAIPPERKDSTTSKRNSRISAGNVDPHAFSLLSLLCKHAVIVWLSDLLFAISDRPLSCFLDLICFSIELFFSEIISLQALHRNFRLTTAK